MWRGLSWLMNSAVHLDSQISKKHFGFMPRNEPETIIKGHVGTGGRIRFKTFGATAIVCIEMKLKIGNDREHLEAIAQVIVECDGTLCTLLHHSFCYRPLENTGCDLNNTKVGFSSPIYCILCPELSFKFFKFERTRVSPFLRGCIVGDPIHLRRGLRLPDFDAAETSLPFVLRLRRVCETVFDMMLCAYISGLKAFLKRSKGRGRRRVQRNQVLTNGMRH